mmetsp:Transcript_24120/g.59620  ORF Transcript_24120/g.59620 Transcript_24120/m.59620 type:complete len:285 (-) Transcript_24120:238-1092(-)
MLSPISMPANEWPPPSSRKRFSGYKTYTRPPMMIDTGDSWPTTEHLHVMAPPLLTPQSPPRSSGTHADRKSMSCFLGMVMKDVPVSTTITRPSANTSSPKATAPLTCQYVGASSVTTTGANDTVEALYTPVAVPPMLILLGVSSALRSTPMSGSLSRPCPSREKTRGIAPLSAREGNANPNMPSNWAPCSPLTLEARMNSCGAAYVPSRTRSMALMPTMVPLPYCTTIVPSLKSSKVEEAVGSNCLTISQGVGTHSGEATQRSLDPVSKMTVMDCAGVPICTVP